MNVCIFILSLHATTPVYGEDRITQVNELNPGDKVCIIEIEGRDDWMAAHWSNGAKGHGGWLHNIRVRKAATPSEPSYME